MMIMCYFCYSAFNEIVEGQQRNVKLCLTQCTDCDTYSIIRNYSCPGCSASFSHSNTNCCQSPKSIENYIKDLARFASYNQNHPAGVSLVPKTITKNRGKPKKFSKIVNRFNSLRITGPSDLTEESSSSSSNPILAL